MENNKELNIPCDGCILLPKCVQTYKENSESNISWPALLLAHKCKLLHRIYFNYENYINYWWNNNYGK